MVVGISIFELHIPCAQSLKAKRRVVKSLIDRMFRHYRVSVAETGLHELHQRAEISIAVVGTSEAELRRIFDKLRDLIDQEGDAVLTDWQPQFLEAH